MSKDSIVRVVFSNPEYFIKGFMDDYGVVCKVTKENEDDASNIIVLPIDFVCYYMELLSTSEQPHFTLEVVKTLVGNVIDLSDYIFTILVEDMDNVVIQYEKEPYIIRCKSNQLTHLSHEEDK